MSKKGKLSQKQADRLETLIWGYVTERIIATKEVTRATYDEGYEPKYPDSQAFNALWRYFDSLVKADRKEDKA